MKIGKDVFAVFKRVVGNATKCGMEEHLCTIAVTDMAMYATNGHMVVVHVGKQEEQGIISNSEIASARAKGGYFDVSVDPSEQPYVSLDGLLNQFGGYDGVASAMRNPTPPVVRRIGWDCLALLGDPKDWVLAAMPFARKSKKPALADATDSAILAICTKLPMFAITMPFANVSYPSCWL